MKRRTPGSKRDDLVRSAKKLLCERGFEAVSPRDVLEASGAGQGSLYHHFTGKLDLAATALAEVSDEMRGLTRQILATDVPPIDRAIRFLRQPRNGLKGCRLGRFASEASISEAKLRQPIDAYFRELEDHLAVALREAQAVNQLDPTLDAAALALMLVAVVQGGFALSRVHREANAINQATAAAVEVLRRLGKPARPQS